MGDLRFNPVVDVGNILTSLSVLVAALALVLGTKKDRALRQREYADGIRRAAAETSALLERRKLLATRLFDEIQPLITDADIALVDSQDVLAVRDQLWRGLVQRRVEAMQRVADERIETAYFALYGYDAGVQKLFSDVAARLRALESATFDEFIRASQNDVMRFKYADRPFKTAQLGNELRKTGSTARAALEASLEVTVRPLQERLVALIEAGDAAIRTGQKL